MRVVKPISAKLPETVTEKKPFKKNVQKVTKKVGNRTIEVGKTKTKTNTGGDTPSTVKANTRGDVGINPPDNSPKPKYPIDEESQALLKEKARVDFFPSSLKSNIPVKKLYS